MVTGEDKQQLHPVQGSEAFYKSSLLQTPSLLWSSDHKNVDNDNHVDQHHDDVDEVDHGLGCGAC